MKCNCCCLASTLLGEFHSRESNPANGNWRQDEKIKPDIIQSFLPPDNFARETETHTLSCMTSLSYSLVSPIVSFCGLLDRTPESFPRESSLSHSEGWGCARTSNLRFWGMHRRREMPYILCGLEDTKCQAGKEVTSSQQSCSWSQLETCSFCKEKWDWV